MSDSYAHLRANAAAQKQTTVDRLSKAISQLEAEGRPVNTFTIKEVSGMDYMAYYRNREAFQLFQEHSTYLRRERDLAQKKQQKALRGRARKTGKGQGTARAINVSPRDPLLDYKRPRLNVASFLGPLWVILISQRLHGGAAAYGVIEAAGIVGGIIGGLLAGPVERRLGAGHLLVVSWSLAGLFTLGIAASTSLLLTGVLAAIGAILGAPGNIVLGTLMTVLIPNAYRGRVAGITRALNVAALPLSALLGGWLTDRIGVVPLFVIGGIWLLGVAVLAWSNRHIRTARL